MSSSRSLPPQQKLLGPKYHVTHRACWSSWPVVYAHFSVACFVTFSGSTTSRI
ncbi:unnamed protein product [Nesidiocoris tenuis]|uniref:Uncharacterized protein n=1 Tax=Nesidiocoris tenuis TaxID=355587 RepID=A0A6H5HLZ1_9HEMI|nr:unnamed protein product [Nesidiocoris tenuis]